MIRDAISKFGTWKESRNNQVKRWFTTTWRNSLKSQHCTIFDLQLNQFHASFSIFDWTMSTLVILNLSPAEEKHYFYRKIENPLHSVLWNSLTTFWHEQLELGKTVRKHSPQNAFFHIQCLNAQKQLCLLLNRHWNTESDSRKRGNCLFCVKLVMKANCSSKSLNISCF